MWGKTPSADWAQILGGRRYPRRNHVCEIWWRSVYGFSVGWGSNFAISHWLWRSSLQHSHTTVWACDVFNYIDTGRHRTTSSDVVRCRTMSCAMWTVNTALLCTLIRAGLDRSRREQQCTLGLLTDQALLQAQCAVRDVVPPLSAAGQVWRLRHRQTAPRKNIRTSKIKDC